MGEHKFNIIEERPLNARKSARRVQCVCQNEVKKIRRAYCLNPKSFGLMVNAPAFAPFEID